MKEQRRQLLYEVEELGREKKAAAEALDNKLREAIKEGLSFSELSRALGQTSAAVRLRANRKEWR